MKKTFYSQKRKKTFSLVETLLYIAISSLILISITEFFGNIIEINERNETITEIESQGNQIMSLISDSVRNSILVNSPANGGTGSSLSINTNTPAKNPTVIDIAAGVIRIKEGSDPTINLSSNRVTVTNLTFRNLTPGSSKQAIKIQFTLSYVNPDNVQTRNYTKTFYGSATLR